MSSFLPLFTLQPCTALWVNSRPPFFNLIPIFYKQVTKAHSVYQTFHNPFMTCFVLHNCGTVASLTAVLYSNTINCTLQHNYRTLLPINARIALCQKCNSQKASKFEFKYLEFCFKYYPTAKLDFHNTHSNTINSRSIGQFTN